ncbi:hypothetical protein BASA81_004926 [Batrachochytrium salamandrivorans]|nr:hypothetical protein BASA81_004926 [Batrachochytrium salamandrivorans]
MLGRAHQRWLGVVRISSHPNQFTLWCCLDNSEWTKRSSVYKRPTLPPPSKAVLAGYDPATDLETQRVEFSDELDLKLQSCATVAEVDLEWKRAKHARGESAWLARSVAISKLANTKRELNRALGAFHKAQSVSTSALYQTAALNHVMQSFFHEPKRVFGLLEGSAANVANDKSYALALASYLQVELNDKTGYFIEKALVQYTALATGEGKFQSNASSGNVGRVLTLMHQRRPQIPLSHALIEEVIIVCANASNGNFGSVVQLLFGALPEFRQTNPLAYLCLLHDAAMVKIRPEACLKVLSEMEERNVPRSVQHFILAASGLRRRSFLDWETVDGAKPFRYVRQIASRTQYNRAHYGLSISPFHIITLQQAYERDFPQVPMHPKFAQELVKTYSSHVGLAPFGTSESFLVDFVEQKLVGERTPVCWEEHVMERLLERVARNFQLRLSYSVARYMGLVRMPRNTYTNNAFLTVFLQHIRQVPQQNNAHIVTNAELLVLESLGNNDSKLKRLLQHRVEDKRVPTDAITQLAPDVTKFVQPDGRTIYLLGALYQASRDQQALFALERAIESKEWAKPLQDLQIQMLTGAEALKLVGELQTTSTVDEHTLHWLVESLLRDSTNKTGLEEAVGNLVGFCRTHKLTPRPQTIKRLQQRATDTSNSVELGRIKDFCDELGLRLV